MKKFDWKGFYDSMKVRSYCTTSVKQYDEVYEKLKTIDDTEFNNDQKKDAFNKFLKEVVAIQIDVKESGQYLRPVIRNAVNTDSCTTELGKGIDLFIKNQIKDYKIAEKDIYIKTKYLWKLICEINEEVFKGQSESDYIIEKTNIDIFRSIFASFKYTNDFYDDDANVDLYNIHLKIFETYKRNDQQEDFIIKEILIKCYLKFYLEDKNLMNEKLDQSVGEALQFKYKTEDCDLEQNIDIVEVKNYLKDLNLNFENPDDEQTYKEAIVIYKNNYKRAKNIMEIASNDELKQTFIDSSTCLINNYSDEQLKSIIKEIINKKIQEKTNIKYTDPDKWKSICKYYKQYNSYRSEFQREIKLTPLIMNRIIEQYVSGKFEYGIIKSSPELNLIKETIKADQTVSDYISNLQSKAALVECEIEKLNNLEIIKDNLKLESLIKSIGLLFPFDEKCNIDNSKLINGKKEELLKNIENLEDISSKKIDSDYVIYFLYLIYVQDNQLINSDTLVELFKSLFLDANKCIYTKNIQNIFQEDHYSSLSIENIVLKWKYGCHLLNDFEKLYKNLNDFIVDNIQTIIDIYIEKERESSEDINNFKTHTTASQIISGDNLKAELFMCKITQLKTYNVNKDTIILKDIANKIIFDIPSHGETLNKPGNDDMPVLVQKLKSIDITDSNLNSISDKETLFQDFIYIFIHHYNKLPSINEEKFNNLIRNLFFDKNKCEFIIGDDTEIQKNIMSNIIEIKNIINDDKSFIEYKYARELFLLFKNKKDIKINEETSKRVVPIIINKLINSNTKEIIENEEIKKLYNENKMIKFITHCITERISKNQFFTDKNKNMEFIRLFVYEIPTNEKCEIKVSEMDINKIIKNSLDQDKNFKDLTDNEKLEMYYIYQYFYNSVKPELYNNKWKSILDGILINITECKINSIVPDQIQKHLLDEIYNSYITNIDNSLQNVLHDVCKSYKIINYYASKINMSITKDIRINIIREYINFTYYKNTSIRTNVKKDIKEIILSNIKTNENVTALLKTGELEENLLVCYINKVIKSDLINDYDKINKAVNLLSYVYSTDNSKCTFSEFSAEDLVLMKDILKESDIFATNDDINHQMAIDIFEIYYKLSNITITDNILKQFAHSLVESNDCKIKKYDYDFTKRNIMDIINNNSVDLENKDDIELIKLICLLRKQEENYHKFLGNHGKIPDKIKSKISLIISKLRESPNFEKEISDEKAKKLLENIEDEEIKQLLIRSEVYESLILCEIKLSGKKVQQKKTSGIIAGVTISILVLICINAAILFIIMKRKKIIY